MDASLFIKIAVVTFALKIGWQRLPKNSEYFQWQLITVNTLQTTMDQKLDGSVATSETVSALLIRDKLGRLGTYLGIIKVNKENCLQLFKEPR